MLMKFYQDGVLDMVLTELNDIKSYMLENNKKNYDYWYHPENNVWFYFVDVKYDYCRNMFIQVLEYKKDNNVCLGIYDVAENGMVYGYIKDWNPDWNFNLIYAYRYKEKYLYLVRKEDYKEEYDKEKSNNLINEFVEYVKTN